MNELNLSLWENDLPSNLTIDIMSIAINDLNVPPSYPITLKHYEALWGDSEVAQLNNNWGGVTWNTSWNDPHTRNSGVIVTRGSSRPAIEGGHYVKFQSVKDYFKDWAYFMGDGEGIYNVQGSNTFQECVKGMFIYGGAMYDYATMNVEGSENRYNLYYEQMLARRNAINNANDGILDRIDNGEFDHLVDGGSGDGGDCSNVISKVLQIINQYKNNVELTADLSSLKKSLNQPVSKFSEDIHANEIFKITKMYNNMLKVNVNLDPDNIDLESNVDQVFNQIIQEINKIDTGGGGTIPDDKPFPPVSNYDNITAVYGYSDGYDGWHAGLDFGGIVAGVDGDPIYATMDGTVRIAEFNDGGLGNVVWIEHSDDDYFSAYAHLSGFNTTSGSAVKKGDVIGYMGNTGYSFGTHLHFVIATVLWGNTETNTIDPKEYLGI